MLSASTLDALKQFYSERDARAEQFARLKQQAEEQHAAGQQQQLSMEAFTEDWNESQFWVCGTPFFDKSGINLRGMGADVGVDGGGSTRMRLLACLRGSCLMVLRRRQRLPSSRRRVCLWR